MNSPFIKQYAKKVYMYRSWHIKTACLSFLCYVLRTFEPLKQMPRKSQTLITCDEFIFLYYKINYCSISSHGHLDRIYCGISFRNGGRQLADPFLQFGK